MALDESVANIIHGADPADEEDIFLRASLAVLLSGYAVRSGKPARGGRHGSRRRGKRYDSPRSFGFTNGGRRYVIRKSAK